MKKGSVYNIFGQIIRESTDENDYIEEKLGEDMYLTIRKKEEEK